MLSSMLSRIRELQIKSLESLNTDVFEMRTAAVSLGFSSSLVLDTDFSPVAFSLKC